MNTRSPLVVITGSGGIGTAVARRIVATGRRVLLADLDGDRADRGARELGDAASGTALDVSDRTSVRALCRRAANEGPVVGLVHTAGVSPTQAPVAAIVAVDLVGTAILLEEFAEVLQSGGAGVVIASMAGQIFGPHLDAGTARSLATMAPDELAGIPAIAALNDVATAYGYAKRGNQIRTAHEAIRWGRRGLRLNSVSPGVIDTAMGRAEQDGPDGDMMRMLVEGSALQRVGDPDEIAAVVEFLLSANAGYLTGTDLLVDGGVLSGLTHPS